MPHIRASPLPRQSLISEIQTGKPNLDGARHIQMVVREGLLLAGGAAALLLQVAMPGVGKGVNHHSTFSRRPLDRLRTTMTFVYCMVFGTAKERQFIVKMVHRAHSPVQGADYSADDIHLQLWVAATLYAVGVGMYEDVFGRIDEATAEALYLEYAILAKSLRVSGEMWPINRKAFWAYWDRQIATMEVTPEARHVAHDLLYNQNLPVHLAALMPWMRFITAELLPPRIREAYGLKSTVLRRGAYRVTLEVIRATYPLVPMFIRTYPKEYYLKDMRRRMGNAR
ncbi:hypothetical protein BO70DRAFT_293528 [Aspergillus heteromorphus CBS 117.55]|uniref:ER-bound oxygenase mpaB/mpaB'/Rubber oxygenase catalytic domain-containing protein n=1 Tax=Aspergillus heteromorphus CBS 117.55 TaxID=1448321 RepID=A0A317W157_9EURO|nr:uncharacterized protein BO70DRAFT_293528 [Aspergillus heteromorphus CBS 117.55]PWY79331.1 hypothetical protein BO70DRAFT_293528 [Aspergillus heteromorphus CBS 117.55]